MRNFSQIRSSAALAVGLATLCTTLGWSVRAAEVDDFLIAKGQVIYESKCASCHGESGQGVKDHYADPLIGDSSIGELTTVIAETMPEEKPESCVGDDAQAVAAYIHEAFYGEAARLRNRPATHHFARLTGSQLQQSLADLYGSFGGDPWVEKEHGLKGSYYTTTSGKKENLKIERTDAVIDFDFGNDGPGNGIDPQEFRIDWRGTLTAEHTGRYELVVRSSCSMQFRFGNWERLLIDNHVQSEGKEEFRRYVTLLAGRQYPLWIEFKQRKRKTELPPAKFSLSWVPPGGTEQLIPTRNLSVNTLPATFAIETKLPPDDESYGYQRGTDINRQWDESTTRAALEFAEIATTELWPDYERKHKKDSDENRGRLRGFLTELLEVAFRGEVDEETRQLYIDRQLDAEPDNAMAIRRVCLLAIKSPRFLYPTLDNTQSRSRRVANRLALVLFDSLPTSDWLIKDAEKNALEKEDRVRQAAERMIGDPRARGKLHEMFYTWLKLDPTAEVTKNQEQFAGFDKQLLLDLRLSLDAFLDEVTWSDSSDYRQLFLADWTFTNERLHEFYGETWKPASDAVPGEVVRSVSAPESRIGVLSHPLLMSHLAYYDTTSPIHRGVYLIRHALGRTLRPPNAAFTPTDPDLHPMLTTRERVELQTGEAKCQVCHQKINSLGFTLENFDTVGRFRAMEKEKPIDASGSYVTRGGEQVSFDGPRELAEFFANSTDAQSAFVENAFEFFTKQPILAYGPETPQKLLKSFQDSGYNIRILIVEIAVIAAMVPDESTPST
ncbi:DUF1588 domain-containing protein [Stieleria varia]|nr:DUF1588 domain-containing protein [Stieleria varia]